MMFHQSQFAFAHFGFAQIKLFGNRQPEHRIADKFQRFVLKLANFFLSPNGFFSYAHERCVKARSRSSIFEIVSDHIFEFTEFSADIFARFYKIYGKKESRTELISLRLYQLFCKRSARIIFCAVFWFVVLDSQSLVVVPFFFGA